MDKNPAWESHVAAKTSKVNITLADLLPRTKTTVRSKIVRTHTENGVFKHIYRTVKKKPNIHIVHKVTIYSYTIKFQEKINLVH